MAIDFQAWGLALAARAQGLAHVAMLAGRLTSNFVPELLVPWHRAKARVRANWVMR